MTSTKWVKYVPICSTGLATLRFASRLPKALYDYLWLVFCLNFNLLSSQSRASFCAAFS